MPRPVLHVAPFLWSGAGSVITRLCESQRLHGPVAIVTAGRSRGLSDWQAYRSRLRRAGVTHHPIDFFHRDSETFWAGVERLTRLLRELEPAVIHAHAGVPSGAAAIARSIAGSRARVIGQMYSWGPNRPTWMNVQDVWGFSQCDLVVYSARDYREVLVHYGLPRRKLTYLPWGLPLDELPWRGEARSAATRAKNGPALGFVGRIEPRKGQLALVHALAHLRRALPGARLTLVGPVADRDYAKRIRSAVTRHGLAGAVTMTGAVRSVPRHVRQWDLFVSLSSDEGQGLAVQEAMALGVPVIVRGVAGISDFLHDRRTGLVLRDHSPRGVASAVRDAWAQPRLLAGIARRARRLVEERYSWDRTVQAFGRLYRGQDAAGTSRTIRSGG